MSADIARQLLADYCSQHGQRKAADVLGYSVTAVNQVLKGTYTADPAHIERTVLERMVPGDTWRGVLRDAATTTSQDAVAQRLGVGASTISQVLSGTYKASTVRIERRVRGELMGAVCDCPVMGEVSTRVCQDVQERRPGKGGTGIGNPQHAQAWHACRGSGRFIRAGACPHFNGGSKPAQGADESASQEASS